MPRQCGVAGWVVEVDVEIQSNDKYLRLFKPPKRINTSSLNEAKAFSIYHHRGQFPVTDSNDKSPEAPQQQEGTDRHSNILDKSFFPLAT